MNEPNIPRAKVPCNPGDALRAALLHNFALRLDLRRVRRDLVGPQQIVAINRLLDANAAVARSLEWLNGTASALPEDFEAPGHLAIESGAVAEAVTQ
jgi:hypothetical protein